jgi:8-oxo-dGTP pyrophosphatase MutT (NUDIX family)
MIEPTENLLRAHAPADAQEADHLARMRALLGAGPRAFAADAYAPGHFTASAFVASPERDAVLLIHHEKLGLWLQPGGHIEPYDRDPAAASLRELIEETGLREVEPLGDGLLDVDVHAIPARPDTPAHEHYDLRFAFVASTRDLAPAREVLGARWVALETLLTADTDASVRRAATRLRSRG